MSLAIRRQAIVDAVLTLRNAGDELSSSKDETIRRIAGHCNAAGSHGELALGLWGEGELPSVIDRNSKPLAESAK